MNLLDFIQRRLFDFSTSHFLQNCFHRRQRCQRSSFPHSRCVCRFSYHRSLRTNSLDASCLESPITPFIFHAENLFHFFLLFHFFFHFISFSDHALISVLLLSKCSRLNQRQNLVLQFCLLRRQYRMLFLHISRCHPSRHQQQ